MPISPEDRLTTPPEATELQLDLTVYQIDIRTTGEIEAGAAVLLDAGTMCSLSDSEIALDIDGKRHRCFIIVVDERLLAAPMRDYLSAMNARAAVYLGC